MIVVVSGLPRSGTSLMMQMLRAGGLPVLTDNERKPDEDNPRGYFELEKVKKIKQDNSWLDEAESKCFKMVSMLLYDLPRERRYKVIFMLRDMAEILASQARMLERLGKGRGPADAEMRDYFEAHLAQLKPWLEARENMDVFFCNYNDLMSQPKAWVSRTAGFLDMDLDEDRMLAAVDNTLYRNRSEV
jgi:hypothetical protein